MDPSLAFFAPEGDTLVPTSMAQSMWSSDQMHGVAVSGALGRALERAVTALGRDDLQPTRYTVDLFRAARMQPCEVSTQVVREGSRICLVDATMTQSGERVARASAVFLKPTASTGGEVWGPDERPAPPPHDVAPPTDEPHVPYFHSEVGWTQDFGQHQNGSRKQSWNSAIPVVAGEAITPFQAAAAIADGASLVTNWGSHGVEYINTDITLTLVRPPVGVEIGLSAVDRVEQDGISVGTAAMFDRSGPLGTCVVTALANARRVVDMGGISYDDDGTRRTTS
ncbi:thioesterase [Nocardioides psychrotolerans]|uniref:Thioesterase-like superfamily protein n=1 Tax=Nocardioides psychrotolerans TaxID=1005945 RepID=A0A1I3F4Y5_9ACTN|nr:acyl-CoA thioesterase domain-containing protein [Nocardioides psychrotolerans]GEP37848.1 thioesterase [Nocardioides psychrotolerans]SFI06305.1 Thioesterase-like superfamily protein [Nocardioides psychrotolerans]